MAEMPKYPRVELINVGAQNIRSDFYDMFRACVEGAASRCSEDIESGFYSSTRRKLVTERAMFLEQDDCVFDSCTYLLRLRKTKGLVATVKGTGSAKSGKIYLRWEPEAKIFIEMLYKEMKGLLNVELPNWVHEKNNHSKKDEEGMKERLSVELPNHMQQTSNFTKKDVQARGIKLGTAERVQEFHRLVKNSYSHRQAKKLARCDPMTYYQWCKEVTGEDPIVPYR